MTLPFLFPLLPIIETVRMGGQTRAKWPDLERVEAPGIEDAGDKWRECKDRHWCRLVAEGRIVRRLREDAGRGSVHLFLVAHRSLPAGEVFALFEGEYSISVYRGRPEAAIYVLSTGTAYNWT